MRKFTEKNASAKIEKSEIRTINSTRKLLMKINIFAFFTLILLTCNTFGMEEMPPQEQIMNLEVNKSGTLLCSVSYELHTIGGILNIWRIVSKVPKTLPLLKTEDPKFFLQSLPQELLIELRKFTKGYSPQSLVLIQTIPNVWNAEFDSDDNLYLRDGHGNLQIWQKKDTHDTISYSLLYNLPEQASFCLNANTLITIANTSMIIFNVIKQTDPEDPIVLKDVQTMEVSRQACLKELSHDSFLLCDRDDIKVYKKEKGVASYTLMKQIDLIGFSSIYKGPNESIIIIPFIDIGRIDGMVWLKENNSMDKPSYEFSITSHLRVIAVDELGRLHCKTPQNTIDILHNTDHLNPQKYQTIAQLPYFAGDSFQNSVITLSTAGTLFIAQGAVIKIWHQKDPAKVDGFKALVQKKEKEAVEQTQKDLEAAKIKPQGATEKLAKKERLCIVC